MDLCVEQAFSCWLLSGNFPWSVCHITHTHTQCSVAFPIIFQSLYIGKARSGGSYKQLQIMQRVSRVVVSVGWHRTSICAKSSCLVRTEIWRAVCMVCVVCVWVCVCLVCIVNCCMAQAARVSNQTVKTITTRTEDAKERAPRRGACKGSCRSSTAAARDTHKDTHRQAEHTLVCVCECMWVCLPLYKQNKQTV